MEFKLIDRKSKYISDFDDKKEICLSKTCTKCHSEIYGEWSYRENSMMLYGAFYDGKRKKLKGSDVRVAYGDFANVDNDLYFVDLNSIILGDDESFRDDIYDKEKIKKMMSFCLREKIKYNKDAFYEAYGDYDSEAEDEDRKRYTEEYFKDEFEEYFYVDQWKERFFCYLNKYAFERYNEFFLSDEYKEMISFKEEVEEFEKLKICPICGGKLSSKCLSQTEREKIADKKAEEFTEKLIKNNNYCTNNYECNFGAEDTAGLKKFLKQLLMVETTILEVSKRLKTLYSQHILFAEDLFSAEKVFSYKINQGYKALQQEYDDAVKQGFVSKITIDDIPLELPLKPVEPCEPKKPIMKTPGFFNKKKVLLENEELNKKYLNDMKLYEVAKEKYADDIKKYQEMVDKLKEEQKLKYEEVLLKEKEENKKSIENLKARVEEEKNKVDSFDISTYELTERTKYNLVDNEMKEAISILEKAARLRCDMYSCDIVFEKYRDIVSVATFYEYLSAGRCQGLEGSDGAYNLYENEIRMNLVVSQLSQVVATLEQIKNNQFVICSTLDEMDGKLSNISGSMDKALSSLSNIETGVSNINKTSEIIAYNTECTAYYVKKNAELTNALGYLVALK